MILSSVTENEIINERLFKDDKNAKFEWSIGIEVIED